MSLLKELTMAQFFNMWLGNNIVYESGDLKEINLGSTSINIPKLDNDKIDYYTKVLEDDKFNDTFTFNITSEDEEGFVTNDNNLVSLALALSKINSNALFRVLDCNKAKVILKLI